MTVTTVGKQEATLGPTRVALLVAVVVASVVLGIIVGGAAHADTTFTVNTSGDENDLDFPDGAFDGTSDGACDVDGAASGNQCTLRAAIQQANVTTGADTITFDIPAGDPGCDSGSGVCTISPTTNLPEIADTVTIDGYTQPGSQRNTLALGNDAVLNIELDGTNAGPANGLTLLDTVSGGVIRGLVINDFDSGIFVGGTDSRIRGNFLGTDPSGTEREGNLYGVDVGGTNNILGGTFPAARNLISGNDENGVVLGPLSSGSSVWGNYIGTNRDGTGPLGNASRGVLIDGSRDNTIGGSRSATEANKIAFNRLDGVTVAEFSFFLASGNRIGSNSIYSNGELGIDLGNDGPTPNDGIDGDTGPNKLQNKPRLTSATTTGTRITIQGTLRSRPNRTFTIRFFANRASEPRGYEGRTFLGLKSVSTDANGEVSFTKVLGREVQAEQRITATATGPGPNTSEFSEPRRVVQH
jgi:hypothetical protein